MIKFYLSVFCAFMVFSSQAQSVKRQSINSLGGSGTIKNVSFHQSVGQPYSTKTYYNESYGIRSGFQQPESFYISDIENDLFTLDVFPNPAIYSVTISNEEPIQNAKLKVIDLNGREVYNLAFSEFKSHSVDCNLWANGVYTIILTTESKELYSSKLIISK